MNDIIKIKRSLEDSGRLIGGVTKAVTHGIKKKGDELLGGLLAPLALSLVQTIISSVVKVISGKQLKEQEKHIWIEIFSSAPFLKQYRDY